MKTLDTFAFAIAFGHIVAAALAIGMGFPVPKLFFLISIPTAMYVLYVAYGYIKKA